MDTKDYQNQTNANVQQKASLIWDIANALYGEYKPHEYGRVILPMTVIKRFNDALKDTKEAVVKMSSELDQRGVEGAARDAILKKTAKHDFYNTSKFDFETLTADSENIASNFTSYLRSFSDNVKDIISRFEFDKEIAKMTENDLLYTIINEFNSKKADMSPSKVTSQDMGYIFEELIRKFSESYDEQAGAHFTARDIIYLMTELLIAPEKENIKENGCSKTAYDMAMGTSQMLGCLSERLKSVNNNSDLLCFGQEFNPETFAIAKADMLIKGGNADNMKFGDTLSNDQFDGYHFDYIISNPPFGIDWKKEKESVENEAKLGFDGRFGPGIPAISDGQLLFLMNGIKKLKFNEKDGDGYGRMAIIQNGSSLITGDAGSGPSEIRKYLITNDYLEAIIQLPKDLFYNTGIPTYIWIITKGKLENRKGKVQLIDASKCFVKRIKSIGSKRVDLSDECISLIVQAYNSFSNNCISKNNLFVESKIFDNLSFGYTKVLIESPAINKEGKPIRKKEKVLPDPSLRDYELIPLQDNIDDYFKNNVLPHNNNSWMDRSKDKIGYDIPFARLFYKFAEPKESSSIYSEIQDLENEETRLMKELFNNDSL